MTRTLSSSQWMDRFSEELRLRGATGDMVGEARATVEAHCFDEQATPDDAFGDPRAYAATLIARPVRVAHTATAVNLAAWLGITGMGAAAALAGQPLGAPVAISLGAVAGAVVFLVFLVCTTLAWLPLRRHPWLAAAPATALLGLWWWASRWVGGVHTHLVTMPSWLAWTGCLALLLGFALRRRRELRDRSRNPITGEAPTSLLPAEGWDVLCWVPLGCGLLFLLTTFPHR